MIRPPRGWHPLKTQEGPDGEAKPTIMQQKKEPQKKKEGEDPPPNPEYTRSRNRPWNKKYIIHPRINVENKPKAGLQKLDIKNDDARYSYYLRKEKNGRQ